MGNQVPIIGGSALVVLIAGLAWWVMSAQPDEAAIQAAAQQPPPLPTVNLQLLSSSTLSDRTVNGSLPITVDRTVLGRDDPFAGL